MGFGLFAQEGMIATIIRFRQTGIHPSVLLEVAASAQICKYVNVRRDNTNGYHIY
jgi:hypothetical protein